MARSVAAKLNTSYFVAHVMSSTEVSQTYLLTVLIFDQKYSKNSNIVNIISI